MLTTEETLREQYLPEIEWRADAVKNEWLRTDGYGSDYQREVAQQITRLYARWREACRAAGVPFVTTRPDREAQSLEALRARRGGRA